MQAGAGQHVHLLSDKTGAHRSGKALCKGLVWWGVTGSDVSHKVLTIKPQGKSLPFWHLTFSWHFRTHPTPPFLFPMSHLSHTLTDSTHLHRQHLPNSSCLGPAPAHTSFCCLESWTEQRHLFSWPRPWSSQCHCPKSGVHRLERAHLQIYTLAAAVRLISVLPGNSLCILIF